MRLSNRRISLPLFLTVFMFACDLWARAGGGGGGSGDSGGGSYGGGSYSGGGGSYGGGSYGGGGYSGSGGTGPMSGAELFFLLAVAIIYLIYLIHSRSKSSGGGPSSGAFVGNRFRVNSGQPVAPELRAKVETAFRTVQQAWSHKNLSLMRRFISDGVYQRFNAQFTMMNLLGQENPISNIRIYGIHQMPKKEEIDSFYESVDIRIDASADDQFVCAKYPELNSPGGNERFVEYWSFIRRRVHKPGKDIYHSDLCPQCNAPLDPKMMADARCNYCGSYINNGEFDWVLSEITQENDYSQSKPEIVLANRSSVDPMFSVQTLEDKASNAFTQILIAMATGDAKALHRFTTDEEFAKLKSNIAAGRVIYNRLFLNSVVTRRVSQTADLISAVVDIRYTFSEIVNGVRGEEQTLDQTMTLVHRPSGILAKGSIYANACPTCGAPQKDSLSHVCAFCGAAMNDITREWLVGDLS
jgi:hypothetical protein